MNLTDHDFGTHKQWRRHLMLESADVGFANTNIAAGASALSNPLYAEGFTHFHGILVCQAAAATTMLVKVVPRRGDAAVIDANDEFTVATLAIAIAQQRYTFYWGEARGLLLGALGTGSTYCFSKMFRIKLHVTGATGVDLITVEALECI